MEKTGTYQDQESPRLTWTVFDTAAGDEDDGSDVIAGLAATPKWLPARYFYDDRGSALFERITHLPEYYPTRTELSILKANASEIATATGPCEIIELGSGSGRKTRTLIDAYDAGGHPLRYLPVDVSGGIVAKSSRALIESYPSMDIWALVGTYEEALAELPPRELGNRMVLFLGSTLGNLNPRDLGAFLDQVRDALKPGNYFLVGVDLQKPVEILEAAYNDSAGVTAAFNRNILAHLNNRFEGDFDPDAFTHRAFYDPEEQQIEMHLVSASAQTATLAALDLTVDVAAGETIHTEISRKFNLPDIAETFAGHGFEAVQHWCDPQDWFAVVLFRAI